MTTFTLMLGAMCVVGAVCQPGAQEIEVGIIDFYGLNRVLAAQVRHALPFNESDTVQRAVVTVAETRLAEIPGVARARVNLVCCEQGRLIVYVGIQEQGATEVRLNKTPTGAARLAPEILRAGDELSRAVESAVERGDAGEDHSRGHALAHDPAARAVQERFIVYARRHLAELRSVLRESSDPSQRALAAEILAYAPDKQAIVVDLERGMRDPAEDVRNNAMRALWVLAERTSTGRGTLLRIPAQPFIEFLGSPVWSDRNKASLALMALSVDRDPRLLEALRKQALIPLVEMARWKNAGHAFPAFIILARIAGYSDDAAYGHWERNDREIVIAAAMNRQ
jgi:hypothetical protein